ncbi:MAG TPA: dihydropteroate synthase, partial [Halothiobacillaceae bacterium]|nr:dihydropteroate synthase [Halothiobacillaceae bacterium]
MGVLNITPDSFSDGGRFERIDQVLYAAEQMISDGADILDIGGESTRPGSAGVSVATELERVAPVIEALATRFDCPLSIDTSNAETINEACSQGVALINDVRALKRPGALAAAVNSASLICLMHMRGEPDTMDTLTDYDDVTSEVGAYLSNRADEVIAAGASAEQLLIDPGFGFAKTTTQNLIMLNQLHRFTELGYPLLVGMSRKRMIGEVTGQPVARRTPG